MAPSRAKTVRQIEEPKGKHICQGGNPDAFYSEHPAWCFRFCDNAMWCLSNDLFWNEILPKLKSWETMTWWEILLVDKKNNHSIDVNLLNKVARDRLVELHIEAEAIVSMRLSATHRLYGYMTDKVFNILWFDDKHGDNSQCVCRSEKKHK